MSPAPVAAPDAVATVDASLAPERRDAVRYLLILLPAVVVDAHPT